MKHFSVPITKINKDQQMVWGYASTPARDFDGDVITLDALKGALPDYMEFANIREMHDMVAVGVTKEAEVDDKGLYIGAKIVDPMAWLKVKEGVYKAFSIGGNATARDPADAHTITGLQLVEISLVDRPANPEAIIDVFKAVRSAMSEVTEDGLRSELVAAVNALSGDALKSAIAAFRKAAPPAEVVKAAEPEPVVKPAPAAADSTVQETPAKRIARCLKAAGPTSKLAGAVAKAVGFNDKQFTNIMGLDQIALSNWLGNNTGLLESIEKGVPTSLFDAPAEQAHKPAPKPLAFDLPSDGDDTPEVLAKKKAEGQDDKPEGDYGSHEDAGYADAGYQKDGKPRYPLKDGGKWSEERIRAAWNYINKPKNAAKYSSEDAEKIKSKIISAWKAQIDSAGPPSAEKALQPNTEKKVTKAISQVLDAKGDLRKGLMTAMAALGLLDRLDGLQKSVAAEEAREGDGSTAGSRFMELLKMMSDVVKSYVEEEVGEMLEGEGDGYPSGYADYIAYGAKANNLVKRMGFHGDRIAKSFEEIAGDRTGARNFDNLIKFAEEVIAKSTPSGESGDWAGSGMPTMQMDIKQDWKEAAQTMHDACVKAGATCAVQKAKGDVKCAACGHMNDQDAEKCEKCDKAMSKSAKADKPAKTDDVNKGKKKPAAAEDDSDDGDDEDESTDGDDDNDEDDDGGNDNPKKPNKTKKKSAKVDKGITVDLLATAISAAMEASPLAKSVKEMQERFESITKNPAKPGKAVPKTDDVTKGAGGDKDKPSDDQAKKAQTPDEVLKGILSRPNIARNTSVE